MPAIPAVQPARDHVRGEVDGRDRLFENQDALGDEQLREHAAALGLDLERFDRELREGVYAARVEEDLRSGAQSGIPSTPRFFVKGAIHLGSANEPELRRVIEAASP